MLLERLAWARAEREFSAIDPGGGITPEEALQELAVHLRSRPSGELARLVLGVRRATEAWLGDEAEGLEHYAVPEHRPGLPKVPLTPVPMSAERRELGSSGARLRCSSRRWISG